MFAIAIARPRRGAALLISIAMHFAIAGGLSVGSLFAMPAEPDWPEIVKIVEWWMPSDRIPVRIVKEPESRRDSAPPPKRLGTPGAPRVARQAAAVLQVPAALQTTPPASPDSSSIANDQSAENPGAAADGPWEKGGDGGHPNGDPKGSDQGEVGGHGPIHTIGTLGVEPPIPVTTPDPHYPEAARRARLEGVVILEAVIGSEGAVHDVRVLQAAHPLLDRAAMEAVRAWTYKPARIGTRPVAVYLAVRVKFALR